MREYSTDQVAEIANCHKSTIHRLMSTGKLGKLTKKGRSNYIEAENKDQVALMVHKNLTRRAGYHRKNGAQISQPGMISQPGDSMILLLMQWVKVPTEKRELLLKLAVKFTADELRLLLEL